MVGLIKLVHRWLRPVAAETPEKAHDTSSMAELVRLLGTESTGTAEAHRDSVDNAHGRGARR